MATSVANLVRCSLILLITLLMVIGCSSPSEVRGDRGISGVIHAPEGEDVEGTVLIACYVLGPYCDMEYSRNTTITQSGSSAPYTFTNLQLGQYILTAFKDITGLPELAPGDYYGEHPELVNPPAQNVDIWLQIIPGGAISGTVFAPEGEDIEGTVVVACYVEWQGCTLGPTQILTITQSGSSAPYAFTHLVDGEYALTAFKDITGLPEFAPGDHYGAYPDLVSPPAQNVDIQLEIIPDGPSGAEASILRSMPRYLRGKEMNYGRK